MNKCLDGRRVLDAGLRFHAAGRVNARRLPVVRIALATLSAFSPPASTNPGVRRLSTYCLASDQSAGLPLPPKPWAQRYIEEDRPRQASEDSGRFRDSRARHADPRCPQRERPSSPAGRPGQRATRAVLSREAESNPDPEVVGSANLGGLLVDKHAHLDHPGRQPEIIACARSRSIARELCG